MKKNIKPLVLLFVLGFVGILAVVALLPQMLSQQAASLPIPIKMLQLISMAQLSVLLLTMIFVGAVFAKKVALTSPVIFALAHSGDTFQALKPQLVPALIGGVLGGGGYPCFRWHVV